MRLVLKAAMISLSIIGLGISFVLMYMQGPRGSVIASALCAPGARVSCADVLGSTWARIGPLATSAWGCLYFAFLATWFTAIGLPNRAGRAWHLLPTLMTLIGAGVSAWLMYVLAVRLPVWCPWCMASHGANFLLLLGCLLGWRTFAEASPVIVASPVVADPALAVASIQPRRLVHPSLGRVAAVLGGFAAAVLLLGSWQYAVMQSTIAASWRNLWMQSANTPEYIAWRWASTPPVAIPIRSDDVTIGDAAAAHTVVVFSDFQCPWCRQLDSFLRDVVTRQPGRLRTVFKHYPLCAECNAAMNPKFGCTHPLACMAARAAEAARRVGGLTAARKYHELLFENAERLAERPYAEFAAAAGVDSIALNRAMADPATAARIAEDVALAAQLGVNASGTVFLDGRRMAAWQIMDAHDPSRADVAASLRLWEQLLVTEPRP